MPVYVVDSNVFIEAHRKTYPLDVARSFWNKIKELADAGVIISIDKVKNELYDKNDDLENWCRLNLPDSFFYWLFHSPAGIWKNFSMGIFE